MTPVVVLLLLLAGSASAMPLEPTVYKIDTPDLRGSLDLRLGACVAFFDLTIDGIPVDYRNIALSIIPYPDDTYLLDSWQPNTPMIWLFDHPDFPTGRVLFDYGQASYSMALGTLHPVPEPTAMIAIVVAMLLLYLTTRRAR